MSVREPATARNKSSDGRHIQSLTELITAIRTWWHYNAAPLQEATAKTIIIVELTSFSSSFSVAHPRSLAASGVDVHYDGSSWPPPVVYVHTVMQREGVE